MQYRNHQDVRLCMLARVKPNITKRIYTNRERLWLDVFLDQGKCINCHKGSEFSGAASVLQKENEENGQERSTCQKIVAKSSG